MTRRKKEHLLSQVADLPWWVGIALAVASYAFLRYLLPGFSRGSGAVIAGAFASIAEVVALAFVGASVVSFLRATRRKKLLEQQADLDSIRALSWQQFELLVSEAFRRQRYAVEERGGSAPDGGVDLVIRKAGRTSVVQCKRWKTRHVGVSLVRELYGVMTAEGADEAIFVASGDYTGEAQGFADGKPIRLIDGATLLSMVREVQSSPQSDHPAVRPEPAPQPVSPSCPKCGKSMVRRTAKTGSLAGQPFWGCSAFPTCRGIRPIA